MEKLRVGLVIAKEERDLSELERFLPTKEADILVFPETYLHSDKLEEACEMIKGARKWVVTSMEDRRNPGRIYETGVVINPQGEIVGEHKKTSITQHEIDLGLSRGDSIETIETQFGRFGLSTCFELYFPEISRVYALQGARIIFNPIGTGMWHEQQYKQWSAVACARAAENGTFVLGCSHFTDAIPIAFAYAPAGECLVAARDVNRLIPVALDFDKYPKYNFDQRRPELYKDLIK